VTQPTTTGGPAAGDVATVTELLNSYTAPVSEFMLDPREAPAGPPPSDMYGNPIHTARDAMPPAAHQAFTALTGNLAAAAREANGMPNAAARIHDDRTIPAESKHALAGEQLEHRTARVDEHLRAADVAYTVLDAALQQAALPAVPPGGEQLARTDARMLLDGGDKPHEVMVALASRPDAVGALVCSSWGADYLASRGYTDPVFHQAVRETGVNAAAAQTEDAARRAAARYRQRLPRLGAGRDTVAQATAMLRSMLGG
jgi:hypothetical protein